MPLPSAPPAPSASVLLGTLAQLSSTNTTSGGWARSVTVTRDTAVAVLNAVAPPLVVVSVVADVWSHARNVIPSRSPGASASLLYPPAGTNRTRAPLGSSSAFAGATAGNGVHGPAGSWNCQVPLVVSAAVTAIPNTAPASTSVTAGVPDKSSRVLTSVPVLPPISFSLIPARFLTL